MQHRIAVIMSLYRSDELRFVKQAVESVLGQSYQDFDFYIQCDGSVQQEVDSYLSALQDVRLHISRRKENRGLARSLNELLDTVMPKGYEYIARMDADDISMPERFEKQMAYMASHPDVECLGTWAVEINADGSEYYRKQMPETHEGCNEQFMIRDCVIHPTVVLRRSYIEKAGRYPTDTYYAEDTMMWAQGFAAGCIFGNVPEYLYYFRLDDAFFERRRGWKHAKGIFQLRKRVNRMLGFGWKEDFYALAYATVKMMPKPILNMIYKIAR